MCSSRVSFFFNHFSLSALRCVLYILLTLLFFSPPLTNPKVNTKLHDTFLLFRVGNSVTDVVFSFTSFSRPHRFRSQIQTLQNSLGPTPGTTFSHPKVADHHARTNALAWLERQAPHAHVFVGPRHCRSRCSRQVDDRAIVHHCDGANETRQSLRTTSSW